MPLAFEIQRMQQELESMRTRMIRPDDQLLEDIRQLTARADDLKQQAQGSAYEPSAQSIHNLLQSLERGVGARVRFDRMAA